MASNHANDTPGTSGNKEELDLRLSQALDEVGHRVRDVFADWRKPRRHPDAKEKRPRQPVTRRSKRVNHEAITQNLRQNVFPTLYVMAHEVTRKVPQRMAGLVTRVYHTLAERHSPAAPRYPQAIPVQAVPGVGTEQQGVQVTVSPGTNPTATKA